MSCLVCTYFDFENNCWLSVTIYGSLYYSLTFSMMNSRAALLLPLSVKFRLNVDKVVALSLLFNDFKNPKILRFSIKYL